MQVLHLNSNMLCGKKAAMCRLDSVNRCDAPEFWRVSLLQTCFALLTSQNFKDALNVLDFAIFEWRILAASKISTPCNLNVARHKE